MPAPRRLLRAAVLRAGGGEAAARVLRPAPEAGDDGHPEPQVCAECFGLCACWMYVFESVSGRRIASCSFSPSVRRWCSRRRGRAPLLSLLTRREPRRTSPAMARPTVRTYLFFLQNSQSISTIFAFPLLRLFAPPIPPAKHFKPPPNASGVQSPLRHILNWLDLFAWWL